VLLSESGIQEGKLFEKGLANVGAVQEAMSTQMLGYAFPFSRFSFGTDLTFVVLAQGKASAFFKASLGPYP
jgi:hypothetical protein